MPCPCLWSWRGPAGMSCLVSGKSQGSSAQRPKGKARGPETTGNNCRRQQAGVATNKQKQNKQTPKQKQQPPKKTQNKNNKPKKQKQTPQTNKPPKQKQTNLKAKASTQDKPLPGKCRGWWLTDSEPRKMGPGRWAAWESCSLVVALFVTTNPRAGGERASLSRTAMEGTSFSE